MPTDSSSAGLFKQFALAVAELRSRLAITDDEYEAIVNAARLRAFRVAGLQQLRLVDGVLSSLVRAVERGEGLDKWRRQLSDDIRNAWGAGSAYRLETIFRNTVQSAFNRGRYTQMSQPAIKRLRPFWMFDAVLDQRTSPICRDRDQVVKSNDDPFWLSNYPPLHHRCRSVVRTLRAKQAERKGITDTSDIDSEPQPGFGEEPTGPVDQSLTPDLSGVDPGLAAIYQGAPQ